MKAKTLQSVTVTKSTNPKMHAISLLVLIAVGAVSADLPGVLSALELLQARLDNDFKFAQVHALLDLDHIVQDTEKGIAAIMKDPAKGARELAQSLTKDIKEGLAWAEEDYREIRSHVQEAIEMIKEELKPTESPVITTTKTHN